MTIDKKFKVDTKVNLYLKFSRIKSAHVAVGYNVSYNSTYTLWGTKGNLSVKRAFNIPPDINAQIILDRENQTTISIKPVNHFLLMIDNYSKILLGKEKYTFNFEDDLLKQARIMEAARKSSQTKKIIKINEIK